MRSKRNAAGRPALVALFIALALVLSACGSGGADDTGDVDVEATDAGDATDAEATDGAETDTEASTGGDYPEVVVENFLEACTGAGSPMSLCQCAIDEIEANYSLEEFVEFEGAVEGGNLPDELTQIVLGCAEQEG